jgi:membrane-bound serine protease (ClpP class)
MTNFFAKIRFGLVLIGLFAGAAGGLGAGASDAGNVFVLPVSGAIDKGMLFVFRRAFREVEKLQPKAVILELDTPGGALNETREIIAWMRSVKNKGCPVYAFVNPDALSAGAMISLASSGIFMSTNATIGSAMPIAISPFGGGVQELPPDVKEKMLSAVRAMVVSLAQENDFRPDVAIAMVDPDHDGVIAGGEVICPTGKLLNLTAQDATRIYPGEQKPLLAKAMTDDIRLVLEAIGRPDANLIRFQEEQADRLARLITALGPLLLGLGILALWIEFKTPGFGVFGMTGIALLAIYFFGHYVAGLAGMEEIALVTIGIVLLAIEIFLIPGFGLTGTIGILCILIGAGLAAVPHIHDAPPLPDIGPSMLGKYFQDALRELGLAMAIMVAGAWTLSRFLPKTNLYHALVLSQQLNAEDGYVSSDLEGKKALLGKTGQTFTMLRPAGTVLIDGQRYDVISNGDLIPKNAAVRVIAVEGTAITVEAVLPDNAAPATENRPT